jgi:hypothetical protein
MRALVTANMNFATAQNATSAIATQTVHDVMLAMSSRPAGNASDRNYGLIYSNRSVSCRGGGARWLTPSPISRNGRCTS